MIKKITLITTILVSFYCFSQNTITATVSEPIEHEAKFSKARGGYFQSSTLVSDNLGGFFMIKMNSQGAPVQKPKSYSIYHYDDNLKLKSESEYLIKRNSAFLGGAFVNGSKISLIQRVKSKIDKKNYNYEVISSSFDSNVFDNKTLLSVPKKNSFFKFSQDNSAISSSSPSGIFTSKNKNFFSIITKKTEKNNHLFTVHVFNNGHEKIFENKFTLEGKDSKVYKIMIDDKNGFVLAKCYIQSGKKTTSTKMLKINKNEIMELKIPDYNMYGYFHELSLSNDKFAIVSFASKIEEEILGISINTYKKNGTLVSSTFNKFSDQFIVDKYNKLKTINSKKFSYRLNYVDVDSDDNIYFSGQEYTRPSTTTMQNSVTGSFSSFNHPAIYDDILVGKLSNKGELLYTRNIKNKMAKANFGVFNNQLNVIAKGTTNSEKSNKFGDTKKPNLYLLVINNLGEITNTKKLVDYKNLDSDLNANTNFKSIISANQKVLITRLGGEKNKRQYIKIKF